MRTYTSEEHRQAISDAIKAKWADPEYREHMSQKMRESAAKRAGKQLDPNAPPIRRRGKSHTPIPMSSAGWGSAAGAMSSKGVVPSSRSPAGKAARQQQQQQQQVCPRYALGWVHRWLALVL